MKLKHKSKHDVNDIIDKLYDEIDETMRKRLVEPDMGFMPDEIDEYFYIEIDEENVSDGYGEDHNAIKVEVRGEMGYEGMDDLAEALNPVVQRYDKDAYFDHDSSGIISAYIFNF